jgi:hypothetical protein
MILQTFVYCYATGKLGGRIERSFSTFPNGALYTVQENAWMDERLILEWVEKVLKPWAEESPEEIRPLLILDSYRCHTTTMVCNAINELGVDLVHIPGGCTPLCQPVDVGINKPFKSRMQNKWEEYLVQNRGNEVRGKIPSPSRECLSTWIIDSLQDLDEDLVKNAWNSTGFSYFNHGDTGSDDDEVFESFLGDFDGDFDGDNVAV